MNKDLHPVDSRPSVGMLRFPLARRALSALRLQNLCKTGSKVSDGCARKLLNSMYFPVLYVTTQRRLCSHFVGAGLRKSS